MNKIFGSTGMCVVESESFNFIEPQGIKNQLFYHYWKFSDKDLSIALQ
jgi:hypothetical protein